MSNLLEQFTAELNRHFFLAEYSFSKNQFKASCGSQFELADHVIALPNALFIFQLKERANGAAADRESVETWFQHKVLKKGCGQIADSLRFFREQPDLLLQNQRGHPQNLRASGKSVIPILLYASGSALPHTIEAKKHHLSKRAGFVHIMNVRDYHLVCQVLSLPRELIAYFNFRQDLLLRKPNLDWTEPQMAAQFINEDRRASYQGPSAGDFGGRWRRQSLV